MKQQYKLISWNVNGIRASLKKDFWAKIEDINPDILALQETKADDSIMASNILEHPDYEYISWHSNTERKGYCGVATLSQQQPVQIQKGFNINKFDIEGRVIINYFNEFVFYNIYFPNGGQGQHRIDYKLEFYDACLEHMEALRKDNYKLIIAGDYNTAHQPVDLHNPDKSHKTTGFLPEERAWLDKLAKYNYIDTFRYMNPDTIEAYSWWDMKTRSRDRNKGWRIDYIWVTPDLKDNIISANILSDVMGSDHAPIELVLEI